MYNRKTIEKKRSLHLVLALFVIHKHPNTQSSLYPLLAAHLCQSGERTSKSEPLLITAEDRSRLESLHGETQVVHHHTHRI